MQRRAHTHTRTHARTHAHTHTRTHTHTHTHTQSLPTSRSPQVMFKVGVCGRTGARRAINVVVKRETLKGKIDTIKDQV